MNQSFSYDKKYMERAIELARLGMSNVAPNPMVGCVIVHQDKIIGEGFHQKYGGPHAEVNAINSVKKKELLKDSTLYVTLEPCAHHGKTPPCSDLIVSKKIPRVVIGTVDPFAQVAGKGIEKLKSAGCRVMLGVMREECQEQNRRFFTFHEKKRPYIILKWAQTLDGFIDIDRSPEHYGQSTWITNPLSKTAVHKMRTDEAAIMVGTNTAEKDNPSLTVRDWHGCHPLRIVLDRKRRLSRELALFDKSTPTLVFTEKPVEDETNLEFVKLDPNQDAVQQMLDELYRREIQSLIVEGGRKLLDSFMERNQWDEARVFVGNRLFRSGVPAPKIPGKLIKEDELDGSRLLLFRNI